VLWVAKQSACFNMLTLAVWFPDLAGLLDGDLKFRPMCMPDTFIEHGDYRDQLSLAGLTPGHIAGTALQVCVFV
jgi:hypothetical protein